MNDKKELFYEKKVFWPKYVVTIVFANSRRNGLFHALISDVIL